MFPAAYLIRRVENATRAHKALNFHSPLEGKLPYAPTLMLVRIFRYSSGLAMYSAGSAVSMNSR